MPRWGVFSGKSPLHVPPLAAVLRAAPISLVSGRGLGREKRYAAAHPIRTGHDSSKSSSFRPCGSRARAEPVPAFTTGARASRKTAPRSCKVLANGALALAQLGKGLRERPNG